MEGTDSNSPQPGSNQNPNKSPKPTTDNDSRQPAVTVANVNESLEPAKKSVNWSEELVMESINDDAPVHPPSTSPSANPYVSRSCAPSLSSSPTIKDKMDAMRNVLGRWGSNVKDAARKAEDLAGNTWQHLKTSPSVADAAMGRIIHSSKVLAEGGYEKIFSQAFDKLPEEQLRDSYACYLSTSAGPVTGVLYVSTAKLAFCSEDPLPYKNGEQKEWSYYKVMIPLHELKAVNRSSNRLNPAEKYIQIITINNHEFWYMGFLNYENAVNIIQGALQSGNVQPI